MTVLCLFRLHRWGPWLHVVGHTYCRTCRRCYRGQTRKVAVRRPHYCRFD